MNNKIYELTLNNRDTKTIVIEGTTVQLPQYILTSIKKHRFEIIENSIYLQRKCIHCNTFFNVQILNDNNFTNIHDCSIRYLGVKSGFHTKCNKCENRDFITNTIPETTNDKSTTETNLVQLNLTIDASIKKYYKLLSINNGTNLKTELCTALIFYKEFIDKNN